MGRRGTFRIDKTDVILTHIVPRPTGVVYDVCATEYLVEKIAS